MRRLLLASACVFPLAAHAQQLDLSGYALTFDDQFNSLNAATTGTARTKWETSVFYGSLSTGNDGSVNPTPPGQAGSQYSIGNGALSMAVSPTSSPYLDTNSAGVPGGFSQQYGYIEASIKQAPGNFWNAFWLMPNAGPWPPEIDILEGNGSDAEFTNHGGDINTPVNNLNIYNRPDLSTGFHTYGLMWTPTTLTWFLDGVAVARCRQQRHAARIRPK